ncbi:MAG: hypothetical protein U0800_24680 [Isosphaeraceae bacterium]
MAIYHRALARLKLGDTSALAEMERVRNDHRLDELIAKHPETADIFLFIANSEVKSKRPDRAIEAGMQGLPVVEKAGQTHTQALLLYVLAESWVHLFYENPRNPENLDLAAHYLSRSIRLIPDLKRKFAVEPYFDDVRAELDDRLLANEQNR